MIVSDDDLMNQDILKILPEIQTAIDFIYENDIPISSVFDKMNKYIESIESKEKNSGLTATRYVRFKYKKEK